MYMGVLPVCMYMYHIEKPGAHRSQKKPSDPLKLKLLAAVSHHVGVGKMLFPAVHLSSPSTFSLLNGVSSEFETRGFGEDGWPVSFADLPESIPPSTEVTRSMA